MVRFSTTRVAPTSPLRDELDNLFTHFFGSPDRQAVTTEPSGGYPPIDVWEEDDVCHIEAELPGVTEGQLEISALGRQLTLAVNLHAPDADGGGPETADATASDDAERHEGPAAEEAAPRKYYRRERSRRALRRVIDFPYDIDVDRIDAKLDLGILTVTVPKATTAKPRKIEVHAN